YRAVALPFVVLFTRPVRPERRGTSSRSGGRRRPMSGDRIFLPRRLTRGVAVHRGDLGFQDSQRPAHAPGRVGEFPGAEDHDECGGDDEPMPPGETAHFGTSIVY